jgi:hypothetical protein
LNNNRFIVMASALGSAAALVSTILIGAAYGGIQVKTNNKIATAQAESNTTTSTPRYTTLEPKTRNFIEALQKQGGPPIYTLTPKDARAVLSNLQAAPLPPGMTLAPANIDNRTIPGGPNGSDVSITVVRPQGNNQTLPVVLYIHGGGWVLGDFKTHERLVRELANKANVAVVFVNYTPAPEAQYPIQIEQANLDRMDRLDFEAWNNRNWTLFEELHRPDVLVVDFTGNITRGIDQHLQWAMAFVAAQPESKVSAHPIKIAAGDWTVATGTLPGNLTMLTLARWEDGRMAEEYLFLQGPPAPMMMNQTGHSQ